MEGHHDKSTHPCKSCKQLNVTEDEMITCTVCHGWEHFGCAEVDGGVKGQTYVCRECTSKASGSQNLLKVPTADKKSTRSSANKTGSRRGQKKLDAQPSITLSISSSTRATLLAAQIKAVDEERECQEQELKAQEELRKREMEEQQRQINERKMLMEEEKRFRELKLQEDKAVLKKQQLIRQQSIEKKLAILQKVADSSSRSSSIPDSREKVKAWLNEQNLTEKTNVGVGGDKVVDVKSTAVPPNNAGPKNDHVRPTNSSSSESLVQQHLPHFFRTNSRQPHIAHAYDTNRPDPTEFAMQTLGHALGPQQIAARQVLGKELLMFSGNPEDWPIFICSFEQSTRACAYSDAENLMRLQRCLRGHAMEAVRSRLLLPSSVPHVIQTLRTLYGRPELVICSLLGKIHRVPAPRHDRLETIMEFGLAVQNLVDHLTAAQQENHLSNPVLMQELVEKLPGPLRLQWAIYKNQQQTATLATFGEFMSGLVTAASEVTFELPGFGKSSRNDRVTAKERGIVQTHSSEPPPSSAQGNSSDRKTGKPCPQCGREGHRLADCFQFKSMNTEERWKQVQQKGLCRTCLNNHGKWPCKSWKGCGVEGCRQKHHTLLHPPLAVSQSVNLSASHLTPLEHQLPLFRMLPVVLHAMGKTQVIFAFIDEGSSLTLLEDRVAKNLGVAGPTEPLTLQWTGNVTRREPKSQRIQLEIAGKNSAARHKLFNARTVSRLVLPSQTLRYGELSNFFPHLRGLPMNDYDLVQPKLLIGLDNLRLGVPLKLREGGPMDPIAAKCRLGWSIYGCINGNPQKTAIVNFHASVASESDRELNEQLRDYFALESAGVTCPLELESRDDTRARRILQDTTHRTDSGFETGLLWKTDNPDFPDSYPMAVRRLHSLERKLEKDPQLSERVRDQINGYEIKGYAHKASEYELASADEKRVWYLPLGVVTNPKKPGKVRLIWDAAAKTQGISFNSKLLKGPDLLTPLPTVLSRFRQFPVAVCGDIKEMFHQIKIRESDRQSQRFLWRDCPTEKPKVYVMDVATFGSTCSPSSAQYVKNINAEEFASQYPRAADAIKNNHYVDDYLDSFKTIAEAVEVVKDFKLVHSKGGFEIRNFLCNSAEVLKGIGELPADGSKDLTLERAEISESVLGMRWIPKEDSFTYTLALRRDLQPILANNRVPTKREVLKVLMSLFDPLGFLSFFLVHGKILMQDIWEAGLDWDDMLTDELFNRWNLWTNLFPHLDTLRIPRCYFNSPSPKNFDRLQIHIFVDASETAYACVAYFRLQTEDGIQVALIGAKTKVAPLKTLSIPRLELNAAVLGTRFLDSLQNHHTFRIAERFLWTDSLVTLAWMQSDHRRYNNTDID